MAHWTAQSTESFIRRITFDFWTQIQKRMEITPLSQSELAQVFGVSESAISQTLNNSRNPTLKTLVNYAQALKLKVAIVAYDDGDPGNEHGPVNSEIFSICWDKAGRPHTFGQVSKLPAYETALTGETLVMPERKGSYMVRSTRAGTRQSSLSSEFFPGASFKAETGQNMQTATNEAQSRAIA
jgi:transcriptional regulator with XRE-family HTH domain